MPWRTELEIGAERQRYLAERRAVQLDVERGVFPFRDIKLDRADIEWLLATHESKGKQGLLTWRRNKRNGALSHVSRLRIAKQLLSS